MNSKDLRDIAAYWGAPYTARIMVDLRYEQFKPRTGKVNASLLLELPQEMMIWQEFKLHLRPINSLTDEELAHCMEIIQPYGNAFMRELSGFRLGHCTLSSLTGELHNPGFLPVHTAGFYAYLQCIGVYVPGSINPDYVQLIEP